MGLHLEMNLVELVDLVVVVEQTKVLTWIRNSADPGGAAPDLVMEMEMEEMDSSSLEVTKRRWWWWCRWCWR